MKNIRIALLAMLSIATLPAFGQAMTSITATSVNAGTGAVTGTLCLSPVDLFNNPISISKSGGGFYLAGRKFCQTLTAGSLASSLSVPNPVTDSATLHPYDITIYDSTSQITTDLGPVYGIGGSTWSLDTYSPSANTPGNFGFNAVTSATGGSGTGTVTCLSASCTNIRGTYSVVGGTFTTGNLLALVWPSTGAAYVCTVVQNGVGYGLGHSVATATGMTVTAASTVAGITASFDYSCHP